MKQVITIPYSIGDTVYVLESTHLKNTNKYEWHIIEAIVECLHIGRKLKYNNYVTDTYLKCRATSIPWLLRPVPLDHAEKFIFEKYEDAERAIKNLNS